MLSRVARSFAALVIAAPVAVGAAVVAATPALGHSQLVSSNPADGATLDAPPAAVTLTFNEEVLDTGTQVVVTDASGSIVADDDPQVDEQRVILTLPADLGAGAFTVAYRVVSADGHPIEGKVAFTVNGHDDAAAVATKAARGASAQPAPVTAVQGDAAAAAASAASAGFHMTGALWALGAAVVIIVAGLAAFVARRSTTR